MPGPCPHRPAGGLLQPRLGSKIVFLVSRGIWLENLPSS
jgi:hypothetical protein